MNLVDSHCHLNFPELKAELPQILAHMRENGVHRALSVNVDLAEADEILALVDAHPELLASVGVHPDERDCEEPTRERLLHYCAHPKVVGIGECGLDYYRCENPPALWQHPRFQVQIEAALETDLPVIIHTRSAGEDTMRMLREHGKGQLRGVIHCFTESQAFADAALEIGFYISFSGIVTFKNAKDIQEVAKTVPLDRILVETDSPYLAPVPFRGKRNDPSKVLHVAQFLADLKGVSLETLAAHSTQNFYTLFNKAKPL